MRKFWLGFICVVLLCSSVSAKNRATVRNGILDLRTWNWRKDGIANLTGDWEFYLHKFYSPLFFKNSTAIQEKNYTPVPSLVNGFGYATYHLTVLCPPSQDHLALKFLTVESAYRLFVNGKEILNVGHADTTDELTIPDLRPSIVQVAPQNNKLDIVIQVANFQNKVGGLWDFVKLGTTDQIYTNLIVNISV